MGEPSNVVYPVPLRPGVIVRIGGLPDDITRPEADRLAALLIALADKPMSKSPASGEAEYLSWFPTPSKPIP